MAPPPAPRPRPAFAGPALLALSTLLAMALVHGWFRVLAGGAALLGAGSLLYQGKARRRSDG